MSIKKALETIDDMLNKRGYKLSENNDDSCIYKLNDKSSIIIFKTCISKINIDKIKEYITHLNNIKINKCILIYSGIITHSALKLVNISSNMQIELFTIDELQYNITHHRLVPNYQKLNSKESKEFKLKFGTKFPVLLMKDPIRRFYNFKRGDVIKITDKYNDSLRYRIVK